ncbi:hypothetical protein D918_02725, partial [Trichuris suis]
LIKLWKSCAYSEKKILPLYFDRRHSKKAHKKHHENKAGLSRQPPPEQEDDRWTKKNYGDHGQLGLPPFSVGSPCAQKKGANRLVTYPAPIPVTSSPDGKENTDKPIRIKGKIIPDFVKPIDLSPSDKMAPIVVESDQAGYAKVISPKRKSDPKGQNEQLEIASIPCKPAEQIVDGTSTKACPDLAKFEIGIFAKVVPKEIDRVQDGDMRHGNFKIGLSGEPKPVHALVPEMKGKTTVYIPQSSFHMKVLAESKKVIEKADDVTPCPPIQSIPACPPGSPDLLEQRPTDPLSFPISIRSPKTGDYPATPLGSPMSPSIPDSSKPAGIPIGLDDIFPIPPSLTAAEKGIGKMNEWNKEQEPTVPTTNRKQNDKPDLLKKL